MYTDVMENDRDLLKIMLRC